MHEDFLLAARTAPPVTRGPFTSAIDDVLALIGDGVISVDEQGRIILFNRAAEDLFGYRSAELIGCAIEVLMPTRFHDRHRADVRGYAATVGAKRRSMGVGREVIGRHRSGHEFFIEATLTSNVFAGQRTFTVVVRDVTARQTAEEKRSLIAAEVAHRLRNTMAVINSVVAMTARGATSLPAFIDALVGRFSAISRMNEALIGGVPADFDLRTLLLSELTIFQNQDRRIVLEGSDLTISGKLALDLALFIHELATNAVKFGALSVATGGIRIEWHVAAGDLPTLELGWQEHGGPAVTAPETSGFGSRLISGILSGHGGSARLTYEPAGVCCMLSLPLK